MSFFPCFKWEMPAEMKAQQPQFFYVSRDQVTAAFNWSSHKFKIRLHQPQETNEHKQAIEKWLLKDVTTLNRFALQNGNSYWSRYQHTRAGWSCNHSYSSSKATGRAQQSHRSPARTWALTSEPAHCQSSGKQKLVWTLGMPSNHSVLLLLTQGTAPSVSKAFCLLLCFIISFPHCTVPKFGLNCSITWAKILKQSRTLTIIHTEVWKS